MIALGVIIIAGVLIAGGLLYATCARLDAEIETEQMEEPERAP